MAAYRAKLAEVTARFDRAARERAAAALRPTSPGAAARLRRFVEEGGAVVTTGQQTGLFTGPLYTVHKILSALRLAEALEAALGVVVLPVFWAASEDHDFAEVNHAHAVAADGELRRVEVAATVGAHVPMSEMRLGRDVESALAEFTQAIGVDEDGAADLALLRDTYPAGRTVAGAFVETVAALFSGFDLLVTDAADPALKAASRDVLRGELEGAEAHERAVAERSARLGEVGYPPQVAVMEGATNVFFHGPAGRERLYRDGDGFVAHDSAHRLALDEARALLETDPARLSPNVFLRPVVESAVFPTLAYVGGPAETAYFAQIQPLFEAFGIRMPVIFPRFSATIVPEDVALLAESLGISDDELRLPEHELVDRVARSEMPPAVWDATNALRRVLVDGFGRVIDAAHGIDANLDLAVGGRRNRALLEAAKAERTIIRHFKKRHPGLARDVRRVRNHLRPLGVPQERVLTVFQYLVRDPGLLRKVADRMTVALRPEPAREEALAPAG